MKRGMAFLMIVALTAPGCANLRGWKRAGVFAGGGAILGGTGGAVFSPNDESRLINVAVFGGIGALVSAAIGYLTQPSQNIPASDQKIQELDRKTDATLREFQIPSGAQLPDFVRARLKPVIVEEFMESDTVSEDGTLHEPHKAYRIKQPGELIAKPVQEEGVHHVE